MDSRFFFPIFILFDLFPFGYNQKDILSNLNLPTEFSSFLQKFRSQSCLIDTFSKFSFTSNCDKLSDELIAQISYELTICSYSKIGKSYPLCDSSNAFSCVKLLEGDLWTTYITYSQHIDNLCFYYKTQIWEKSSEFIFEKLLNSSTGILYDLQTSSQMAKDIFVSHEKFAVELKDNLSFTMQKIESVNEFFDNYTQTEEKIKSHLNELENKINKNKVQIEKAVNFFEDKISFLTFYNNNNINNDNFFLNFYKYFFCILLGEFLSFAFLMESFSMFIIFDFLFILYELFILNKIISFCSIFANINYIVTVSRILYIVILCFYVIMNHKYKSLHYHRSHRYYNNNTNLSMTEVKNFLMVTPLWVKKYASKVSPSKQNELIIGAYKEMQSKFIQ